MTLFRSASYCYHSHNERKLLLKYANKFDIKDTLTGKKKYPHLHQYIKLIYLEEMALTIT